MLFDAENDVQFKQDMQSSIIMSLITHASGGVVYLPSGLVLHATFPRHLIMFVILLHTHWSAEDGRRDAGNEQRRCVQ